MESMDDYKEELEASFRRIREGDILTGTVIDVNEEGVTLDGVVDIRLGFFIKVDNFSVAAALEVEYSVVVPAVLVITDEETLRVGRKSGLSGTGQTEEDSGILTV